MEPGEYEVLVGASCVDIRLRAQLTRTGPRRDEVGGAAVEPGYRTLDDAMLAKLGLEVPPAEGPLLNPDPNPNPSPNPNPNPNPSPNPNPNPSSNPDPNPGPGTCTASCSSSARRRARTTTRTRAR